MAHHLHSKFSRFYYEVRDSLVPPGPHLHSETIPMRSAEHKQHWTHCVRYMNTPQNPEVTSNCLLEQDPSSSRSVYDCKGVFLLRYTCICWSSSKWSEMPLLSLSPSVLRYRVTKAMCVKELWAAGAQVQLDQSPRLSIHLPVILGVPENSDAYFLYLCLISDFSDRLAFPMNKSLSAYYSPKIPQVCLTDDKLLCFPKLPICPNIYTILVQI